MWQDAAVDTMQDDRLWPSNERRRIAPCDLRYPVLIIRRHRLLDVFPTAESLTPGEAGLLVDTYGLAYQVEDVSRPDYPFLHGTQAERRRPIQEWKNSPPHVHYKGDPVQLSVDDVRMKIVWQVSARGHFEVPQGLPDLSRAESVADVIAVLLRTGFR